MPDRDLAPGKPSSCEPRSNADALSAQEKERYLAEPCRGFELGEDYRIS